MYYEGACTKSHLHGSRKVFAPLKLRAGAMYRAQYLLAPFLSLCSTDFSAPGHFYGRYYL